MDKSTLIKLHWFLASQFGLDPLRFIRSLEGLPRFIRNWWQFLRVHGGRPGFRPCLHDRFEQGGTRVNIFGRTWPGRAGFTTPIRRGMLMSARGSAGMLLTWPVFLRSKSSMCVPQHPESWASVSVNQF